jgi:3'-5' exoribonuclease
VVDVSGEIGLYRGQRQLEVAAIRVVRETEIDWHLLLPSAGEVAAYWREIDDWRAGMGDGGLRRIVGLFYDDPDFRRRYGECPASTIGHHAELGGLLRHTREVASIGIGIAFTCGADPALVLAGALLHDIGKLEAYSWTGAFETTDRGALVGHVALGLLMLDRRIDGAVERPCTEHERLLLQHLIASHHGKPEFGATAPPMTLEAEILHFADDASAKCASMAAALADEENFTEGALLSHRGIWQLDRRKVYRSASVRQGEAGAKKERPHSRG